MRYLYSLLTALTVAIVSARGTVHDNEADYEYSYGPTCFKPYLKIGKQCLFFSQPYAPWGIDESWEQAYLSFYDAVALCRQHGGDLAGKVKDYGAALRYCLTARGGCAPSLLWRGDKCFQWSPLNGGEAEVPCRRWDVTMRFVCEMRDFERRKRRKRHIVS